MVNEQWNIIFIFNVGGERERERETERESVCVCARSVFSCVSD